MTMLRTIGEVARLLGEPICRLEYAITSRRIEPAMRAGNYRLFDEAGVERIRRACAEIHAAAVGRPAQGDCQPQPAA